MVNKRGQFFLLAAVIISVVIMGLGVEVNQAISTDEPEEFYDFSYEVKREVGEVIDYEVYSSIEGGGELDEFVELLAEDIAERSPDSSFLIVYGDEEGVQLKSSGDSDVVDSENKICFGGFCQGITSGLDEYVDSSYYDFDGLGDEFVVELRGNEYSFPVSEGRQVLFIMQKDIGEETYVSAG